MRGIELAERGLLPDLAIRVGIRQLNMKRLRDAAAGGVEEQQRRLQDFIDAANGAEIAIATDAANRQHYEVPAEFFQTVLGPRLKYSSGLFPPGVHTLQAAEDAMLALATERAQLTDGMQVLDLGCGWGSWSLYLLERFPNLSVVAVSNSASQGRFLEERAKESSVLDRLRVVTCDVNELGRLGQFDRIVCVEMLEHVKNHERLFAQLAPQLTPEGKAFVHVFCHRSFAYHFDADGNHNWMGRHFFTGGCMPSFDYLLHTQRDFQLEQRWAVSGRHYSRTAGLWLLNLDAGRERVLEVFRSSYGVAHAELWLQRWRIFFMACEELWGFGGGDEWHVGHYLFSRVKPPRSLP